MRGCPFHTKGTTTMDLHPALPAAFRRTGTDPEQLTPDQISHLHQQINHICTYYPRPDQQPERDAALDATIRHLRGLLPPRYARQELEEARHTARQAFAAALQVAALQVDQHGGRRHGIARACGVDPRMVYKIRPVPKTTKEKNR